MQFTPEQVALIKVFFIRMKLCFILLMFMFISIYFYANKHPHGTPHNYWLVIIITMIVICSLGYLYYIAKLAKSLGGNPTVWVVSTAIFGPFGLLISYIILSGNMVKLQRQHTIDLEQENNKNM